MLDIIRASWLAIRSGLAVHRKPTSPRDRAAGRRHGPNDTAFAYRDATYGMVFLAASTDPTKDAERIQWVRDYYQALAPYSEPGGYINFMQDDDYDRIQDNYRQNYDRLVQVEAGVRSWQPVPHQPEHNTINTLARIETSALQPQTASSNSRSGSPGRRLPRGRLPIPDRQNWMFCVRRPACPYQLWAANTRRSARTRRRPGQLIQSRSVIAATETTVAAPATR